MTAPGPHPDRVEDDVDQLADSELAVVFRGSQSEATVLQSILDAAGLHPFLESQYIKTIDPFITGGNIFEVELKVPAPELAAAGEVIAAARSASTAPGVEDDAEAGVEVGEAGESESEAGAAVPEETLEDPGRAVWVRGLRLRWASLLFLVLLTPLLLALSFASGWAALLALLVVTGIHAILALDYFLQVRRIGARPLGHGVTVLSVAGVALAVIGILLAVARAAG